MTAILEAHALGMQYGRRRALTDCTLDIPPGHVVGLVGPNGAGKSTLLKLACGLLNPTSGSISVLGRTPGSDSGQLARVGFLAQDAPVYAHLTVGDHLRLGARLNQRWDQVFAERRIAQLGLDPSQKAGKLSGGQRAQLALTVAAGFTNLGTIDLTSTGTGYHHLAQLSVSSGTLTNAPSGTIRSGHLPSRSSSPTAAIRAVGQPPSGRA